MGKKFRKLLAIILSIGMLASFCAVPMTVSADGQNPLKFGSDGKFKIVIFSDVQDQFPVHQRVINIMEQAIERENPDLVVFLGDITEQNIKDPEVDYRRSVEQIFAPVVNAGVPYAIVFGNHDDQSYYSGQRADKDAMLSVIQSLGDCRTIDADPTLTGTGTCKIPIYASGSDDVAFDLFMVDSNTYQNPTASNHGGYDNPHADQLEWLASNKDAGVNSLVFQHIPMPEIYNLLTVDAGGEKTYGSTKYAKTLNSNATGYLGEYPCPPNYGDNTGEFAALKAMGGVLGVFTGHDHLNDFTGTYDGLTMTAVPGMTYYNYGEEAVRGYGVIELDEGDLSNYEYQTVKFSTLDEEAGASEETTYDEYDEVTYDDLRKDGNPLDSSGYTFGGKNDFTYSATSPSYSAVFKFRWIAGSETGIQFSFDQGSGSNISYPFGVWVKKPNSDSAGANGAWHLKPTIADLLVNMNSPATKGSAFDIEFGRLKVLTGAPQHVGEYYVYLKVNGTLIQETYSNTSEDGEYMSNNTLCQVSNIIRINDWGSYGNKISAVSSSGEDPGQQGSDPDSPYYDYDEITYYDLLENGSPLPNNTYNLKSKKIFTYNRTSETYSAVFKYRWTAGSPAKFSLSFDTSNGTSTGSESFPFCAVAKYPNQSDYGAVAGPNGAWQIDPSNNSLLVNMSQPLVSGNAYDIEFARLKVKEGDHAGEYYVYLKVDGTLVQSYYYSVNADGTYKSTTLSNYIVFTTYSSNDNVISATPQPETYDDYDEVTYYDLLKDGKPLTAERTAINGNPKFAYNCTSPSYSVVFKYRWTAGSYASGKAYYVFYFDKWGGSAYPFAFAVKSPGYSSLGAAAGANGAWHLDPSKNDHIVQMSEPIVVGNDYDIEHGRLKVVSGENTGKYYVYVKVNGEMIYDYYYDGDNGNGTYGSGNQAYDPSYLRFTDGTADSYISAIPELDEYDDYDEIGYSDLTSGGEQLPSTETTLSGSKVFNYARTSASGSVILKYRWKVGSVAKAQLSFEKTASNAMAYMFGAWLAAPGEEPGYDNGRMWLRPGSGPQVNMSYQLQPGNSYNVEFARLKIVSGPNKGKYHVYIKIDDELIAEDYVASGVVDSAGNYVSNPNSTACNVTSGEIFFAHWGSEGNKISAYSEAVNGPVTIVCDFDGNGRLNAIDLAELVQVLLGAADMTEMPEGVADFNHDGAENIIDLICLKKYLAPVNSYAKSGDLVLGTQEHLLEKTGSFTDTTKTAAYIADASATLGAGIYRLSMTPGMYYKAANEANELRVFNYTNLNNLKAQVAALKAQGITEILFVADSFILPYGYEDPSVCHGITVPDPLTEPEYYQAWLEINARGFAAVAALCPEIHYFEPFNEINLTTTRMEKLGCAWNSTAEEQANYKFTVAEKARIAADLCYYISEAVKAVNPANQVTTPSICVGSTTATIEGTFLDTLYKTIESGQYPTGKSIGDMRVDNYFTIVNIHNYPPYVEDDTQQAKVNQAADDINAIYNVMKNHNDGGTRVWLSETGVSSLHGNGTNRDLQAGANFASLYLNKINNDLTFIDTVIFYKLADSSTDYGANYVETAYGLFYAGDDLDYPYEAKPIAKTVYSFFHNGSTDYSAIDALVARYAG